jgi:polyisoprenoid-binding protein YceI
MTDNQPGFYARHRRLVWGVGAAVVLAVALAGVGIWWFFRDDAPPEVSLGTAVGSLTDDEATTTTTGEPSAATVADDAAAAGEDGDGAAAADGISGRWTIDTTTGTFDFDESTGTFVGFRVKEELQAIGSTTAVGRTPAVSGTIEIDGTTVTAVEIEADMTQITTNESRRNGAVQRALDTGQFPTATFSLTAPIELGDGAASGDPVELSAQGDLTIHGVTTPVEIPLEAQLVDDTAVVVGSLDVVFADYGVSVPSAPVVLSAEDHGVVELQLLLTR